MRARSNQDKYLVLYSPEIDTNNVGFDNFPQEVTYSYKIKLETPSDFREVTESDKIDVAFFFYGDSSSDSKITFSEITGWWKDTGKPSDLLEANRLVLDNIDGDNYAIIDKKSSITGRLDRKSVV